MLFLILYVFAHDVAYFENKQVVWYGKVRYINIMCVTSQHFESSQINSVDFCVMARRPFLFC